MGQCSVLHLSQCVTYVPAVVLMITAYIDHWALKNLACPFHAPRFDINVAGENYYVRVAWGGIEPSELEVQV